MQFKNDSFKKMLALSKSEKDFIQEVVQVMIKRIFQNNNFCVGYKIRRDDSDNGSGNNKDEPIFDELDDDSLISGLNVDCLVSIYGPASLGASLQINGEGSRFGPDFVGTTLAAIWDTAGIKSSWETFFVDPEYRWVVFLHAFF